MIFKAGARQILFVALFAIYPFVIFGWKQSFTALPYLTLFSLVLGGVGYVGFLLLSKRIKFGFERTYESLPFLKAISFVDPKTLDKLYSWLFGFFFGLAYLIFPLTVFFQH
jgi:hypothetical protein